MQQRVGARGDAGRQEVLARQGLGWLAGCWFMQHSLAL